MLEKTSPDTNHMIHVRQIKEFISKMHEHLLTLPPPPPKKKKTVAVKETMLQSIIYLIGPSKYVAEKKFLRLVYLANLK